MKRYRIREGSVAHKVAKAVAAIDREPAATIAFCVVWAAFLIVGAWIYNGVVPAYQ